MTIFLLAILFIIMNILEVTTTNRILRDGGYEANPMARFLMRIHLFIPAKILMVVFIVFLMVISSKSTGITVGILCCGIYFFIVLNNTRII
jgi:hypothetical protein